MQVRIPATLRKFTGGADTVDGQGLTIGEVLNGLCERYQDFRPRLFKPDGSLNRFVNVFLNNEDIRFIGELKAPVKESDEVSIIQAVAGG